MKMILFALFSYPHDIHVFGERLNILKGKKTQLIDVWESQLNLITLSPLLKELHLNHLRISIVLCNQYDYSNQN